MKSALPLSVIVALVAVAIALVLFFVILSVVLWCCYRKRKSKKDLDVEAANPLNELSDSEEKVLFWCCCPKRESDKDVEAAILLDELAIAPPKTKKKRYGFLKSPGPKQSLHAGKGRKTRKIQARDNFLESEQDYKNVELVDSPDCGSRMQKLWTQLEVKSEQQDVHVYVDQMISIMPLSQQCQIQWQNRKTVKRLRKLLDLLQSHPFIHPILRIAYDADTKHVVVTQPYIRCGSLKDYLYHCKPNASWESKYKTPRRKLPTAEEVALYGRQILEALLFLYGTKKISSLGHVQSGNVFLEDQTCRLAGYENTLLGYKTRLHKLFKDHLDHIDVIMFGHLVFEMTCGYELTTMAPTSEDYAAVKRSKNAAVYGVLKFIFASDNGSFPAIAEIQQLSFFWDVELPQLQQWNEQKSEATQKMNKLLSKLLK